MLRPPIALLAPAIAIFLTGEAGAQGEGGAAPAARRSAPVLPVFPALGAPRPTAPESYPLRDAGDGSGDLVYDGQGFSARVARDGGVAFKDRRARLRGPLDFWVPRSGPRNVPSLQATIQGLMRNGKVPRVDEDAQTDGSYLTIPNLSRYRPDPREGCRACSVPLTPLPLNATGRFDLTDELMRFHGQDPYRFQKAHFLAATRDTRIAMAVAAHAENVWRAAAELPGLLERIACNTGLTRRERQTIIEKLREELDGETPEARAAAQQIERFLTARFASPVANDGCAAAAEQP